MGKSRLVVGNGMGVLPTLPTDWFWSIESDSDISKSLFGAPGGPGGASFGDIWQTDGILYVYRIPEPSRAMLLLIGALALLGRRRR